MIRSTNTTLHFVCNFEDVISGGYYELKLQISTNVKGKRKDTATSALSLMLLPLSGTNIKKQERKVLPASLFEIHFNPGCRILCPPFTISAINEVSNRFQTITGCNIRTARQQNRTSGIN